MKSIQTKILTVVISGLLVITAIVSAIAVNMTHTVMHKDADRILNNVTQKEAAYINDILGDMSKSAAIMQHYAITEIDSIERLKDSEYLNNYLAKTKKMFTEIALQTNGIKGFFLRLNPKITSPTTGYYNLISDENTIREMQVTDLSKYSEDDTKNVGWYYTAVKAGKPVWLDPYYFPGYNNQLISYTVPVYIGSELLGVIGFDMDFGYLTNRIDSISVYENGYAILLANDGETPYNNLDKEESTEPHTKATAELQNGMYLELRADYKDIQQDIHPMLKRIIFAFLLVLCASILYTILVTHRIVKPLKELTAAAEALSTGISDSKVTSIPMGSKDEVGTLANVLKNTYEKISEYTTYINALAYRDSLTGIKNSTAYTEVVTEMNKEINCGNARFGVLVADINNLKQTNDRHGHDVGNELIIHTAKILVDIFKNSLVFRIGGDEFAIILKGKDYDNYSNLLNRLDVACSEDFVSVMEAQIPVSLARGGAFFDPDIDKVYEDVFAKADHAMYMNKEQSKATSV